MIQSLIARFKEPSTYAGLGVLLMAFGVRLEDALWNAIVQVGIAGASLAAIVMAEKGNKERPKTGE